MRKSGLTVALALTWDGARWPVRALPADAKKFLKSTPAPVRAPRLSQLLAAGEVRELRICWVPRLKGGDDVLCPPFQTATGRRLSFRARKQKQFGDVLGIVYSRTDTPSF